MTDFIMGYTLPLYNFKATKCVVRYVQDRNCIWINNSKEWKNQSITRRLAFLFNQLARGVPELLLKTAAEIKWITKTNMVCNFRNIVLLGFK